jgi:probable rRNA maturation factor
MSNNPRPEGLSPITVIWEVAETLGGQIDVGFLESVLEKALSGRRVAGTIEIGVTVTTDDSMREINRQHRGVDATTDVLSFPLLDYERPEEPKELFPLPPGEPLSLGDIVVSYPRAVEQATAYGHSLDRELAFLVVHGTMHLLGYDHQAPGDEDLMRREEESVLARLNLTR